jgi:hypothetical protein
MLVKVQKPSTPDSYTIFAARHIRHKRISLKIIVVICYIDISFISYFVCHIWGGKDAWPPSPLPPGSHGN